MGRIGSNPRQISVALIGMIVPHLFYNGPERLLMVPGKTTFDEVHERRFVRLHTRREPQRGGLNIADEVGRTVLKSSAAQGPHEFREVSEVALRRRIHPAICGVRTESENESSHNTRLIVEPCSPHLGASANLDETGIGGCKPA